MVIVRMPPSPTGKLHLGTARTALFNYLFAKHHNGKIIFRWEDTDRERSKKEFEHEILSGLKWLGMDFEKESGHIFRQTENEEIHKKWLQKLWENGKVFPCFTPSEEVEKWRNQASEKHENFVFWSPYRESSKKELEEKMTKGIPFVWRIRAPKNYDIVFNDLIRGEIHTNSDTIGDFAVARSDGSVLYLLANVVDDWTQEVTHVLRGEDHISNTPKQILIYEALEANQPQFGHIPLVLDNQKRKLSKRNVQPGVCVLIEDFKSAGFLPEGVINGLSLLGWNPKTTEEIFDMEKLIEIFDIQKINSGAAQYNFEKMQWINTHWVRNIEIEKLIDRINEFTGEKYSLEKHGTIFEVARTKSRDLKEVIKQLDYLINDPGFDPTKLPNEKMSLSADKAKQMLDEIKKLLEKIDEQNFTVENIREQAVKKIESLGVKNGEFLHPFRIALSNQDVSAGPFEIAEILGKVETLRRIERSQK